MELWQTGEHGFVHLPTCFMLDGARRQGGTPVRWTGEGNARACRRCILKGQKRIIRRPCVRCGHATARPCHHNGTKVLSGNQFQRYAKYAYADHVIEADWLRSLLD